MFQLYPECADSDDWRWLVLGLGICVLLALPILCLYARQQAERVVFVDNSSGVCWLCTIHSYNVDIPVPKIDRTNIIYTMPLFMAGGMIYLYRDKLKLEGIKQYLLLTLCIVLSVLFFVFPEVIKSGFGALVSEMVLFGSWLIYALGSKDLILNNRVVRFISGISMEVYLCHMVMFRVVEKVHLERFIADGDILYALTCILVIAGAVAFSWGFKKVERIPFKSLNV